MALSRQGRMQVMAAILSDGELNSMVLTFLVQVPEVDHRLSASTWTQFGPLSPTQPPSMCCCHLTLASQYTHMSAPVPLVSVTSFVTGSPCQVRPLCCMEHSLEPLGLKSIPVKSRQGRRTEDARTPKKTWRHFCQMQTDPGRRRRALNKKQPQMREMSHYTRFTSALSGWQAPAFLTPGSGVGVSGSNLLCCAHIEIERPIHRGPFLPICLMLPFTGEA